MRNKIVLLLLLGSVFFSGCTGRKSNIQEDDISSLIISSLDTAAFLINSGNFKDGVLWLDRTDSLLKIKEDLNSKSHVFNNYAWVFEKRSLFDSAQLYYRKALEISESLNDSGMIINRLKSIGRIHQARGEFTKAAEFFERALNTALKIDDEVNIASVSNGLGNIFLSLNEPERAFKYFERATSIWERDGSKRSSYSIALHNLATALVNMDSTLKALPLLYRALRIKDSLGRESSKAFTYNTLGVAYEKLDSLDRSRSMFIKAYDLRSILNDRFGIGQVLYRLSILDIREGKYGQAANNLIEAEKLAIEFGAPELLRNVLSTRKNLYKATNRLSDWIATDEIYDVLTDSLQRKQRLKVQEAQSKAELEREQQKTAIAEQNARIANIEAESERQKGQLRLYLVLVALLGIVIASWQLWQIRKRNASLITLNERIKLITDNAFHSQKNALGLISALLRSKARQTAHDKELEVLRDVEGKIEALGGVAKYLFQTRLTDNIEVAASIQLATYLETLIQDTFSSVASDMAKLEIKLEEISVTSTEALNIGLIANEAITNFSKYAETFGADELQIKTKRHESELLLQIRDNGPGFPEGFNISKSTGFGMQMMANLVDDMEGALSMFRQEGWTLIQITIPLKA